MADVVEFPKVVSSIDEITDINDVEYREIDGFKPGQRIRIGSLSAGDFIEWQEANDGEAKKTAGLRLLCKSLVGPEPSNIRYASDPRNIAVMRTRSHRAIER